MADAFDEELVSKRVRQEKIKKEIAAAEEEARNSNNWLTGSLAGLFGAWSGNKNAVKEVMEARAAPANQRLKALRDEQSTMNDTLERLSHARAERQNRLAENQTERSQKLQDDMTLAKFKAGLAKGRGSRVQLNPETGELESVDAKQISAPTLLNVNEGNQIPSILSGLKTTLSQKQDLFGPVAGRLSSMNPYDTSAQTVDAQLRTASQIGGKFLEGGVLKKEDEVKYRRMFPNISDTPEVAAEKLSQIEKLMTEKQKSNLDALSTSGYDTRGLRKNLPQTPSLVTVSNGSETFQIPASDLAEAEREGFKVVGGTAK